MPYPARDNARAVAPAIAVGLIAVLAMARSPVVVATLGRGWGSQACLVFLLVMAAPLLGRTVGTLGLFGAANAVTTVRAVIAAIVGGCVGRSVPPSVLWGIEGLVITFAVLDGVDGWLARTRGLASAFGARFDMETDARSEEHTSELQLH